MILYSLACSCGHSFEDWFDNSADFDRKSETGTLTCPACHGHDVRKAIMAPSLGARRQRQHLYSAPLHGRKWTGRWRGLWRLLRRWPPQPLIRTVLLCVDYRPT